MDFHTCSTWVNQKGANYDYNLQTIYWLGYFYRGVLNMVCTYPHECTKGILIVSKWVLILLQVKLSKGFKANFVVILRPRTKIGKTFYKYSHFLVGLYSPSRECLKDSFLLNKILNKRFDVKCTNLVYPMFECQPPCNLYGVAYPNCIQDFCL